MLILISINVIVFVIVAVVAKSGKVFLHSIPYMLLIILFFAIIGSISLTVKILLLLMFLGFSSTILLYFNLEKESRLQ